MKNLTLNEVIANYDHLLFIGYRGSRSLGLETKESDHDYLIITDKSFKDDNVLSVTLDEFKQMADNCELEAVEASCNPLWFANANIRVMVEGYAASFWSNRSIELFKCQLFLLLKNQLKQSITSDKFKAKVYLYWWLYNSDNPITYYKQHHLPTKVKFTYLVIRYGYDCSDLIENIRQFRYNSDNRLSNRNKMNSLKD